MKLNTLSKEDLIKKLKVTKLILLLMVVISVILGIVIYISQNPSGSNFSKPIDEKDAITNVGSLRSWPHSNGHSSRGVSYDSAEIRYYLDTIYHQVKDHMMSGMQMPAGYEWRIGFYWMMRNDPTSNKSRRDFCVLPVLIQKLGNDKWGKVIDYFDDVSSSPIYNHQPMPYQLGKYTLPAGSGNAYDNGQMWP